MLWQFSYCRLYGSGRHGWQWFIVLEINRKTGHATHFVSQYHVMRAKNFTIPAKDIYYKERQKITDSLYFAQVIIHSHPHFRFYYCQDYDVIRHVTTINLRARFPCGLPRAKNSVVSMEKGLNFVGVLPRSESYLTNAWGSFVPLTTTVQPSPIFFNILQW